MTSDKKDLDPENVNETEESMRDFSDDDMVDFDPEELSAMSGSDLDDDLAGDLDIDITGDETIDFADEDTGGDDRGGAMKKMAAPLLVLVLAAGVGGFIVMNPQILGGSGGGAASRSPMEYTANPIGGDTQQAVQDITEGTAVADASATGDSMFSDTLPQPTATQNEMPRGPDASPEPDLTENTAEGSAVASAPVAASSFPDMGAEEPSEMPTEQGDTSDPSAVMQEENAVSPQDTASAPEESGDDLSSALYAMKFPDEESAAGNAGPGEIPEQDMAAAEAPAPVATPSPVAQKPPVEKAEEKNIQLAQADIKEVPEASPPEMPTYTQQKPQDLMPAAKAAPAPAKAPDASMSEKTSGTADAPVAQSKTAPASDVYYDGRVPTGPLAAEAGPRKVDPVMEPAQQFVVVKKSHGAQDTESILASANRALQLKRYDAALEMYDQLYAKNARDPRVLMGRAVAQQNQGMSEAAIRSYEELLDIDPKNADAMLNMLGLLRKQYPEVALRRLMELYNRYPDNAGVAAQIGVTQADLGHTDDALRYLGIASTIEPQNAQHVFNMAIIADRSGNTNDAIKFYEKALELDAVYSGGRSIPRDSVYDRLATLRKR